MNVRTLKSMSMSKVASLIPIYLNGFYIRTKCPNKVIRRIIGRHPQYIKQSCLINRLNEENSDGPPAKRQLFTKHAETEVVSEQVNLKQKQYINFIH